MRKADRKAALAAWKEERRRAGVWALRCGASAWVGAARDLAAARNRVDFALSRSEAPMPAMKAAMAAHGPGAFVFEEVEEIGAEVEALALPRVLKERRAAAAERLGAKEV